MRSSYAAAPTLHRGAACLECRRRKLKCDGARPVCGCCQRGRRPKDCDYDPPEGKAFRLQQRIRELEATIQAIEAQPRRSNRSSPASSAAQTPHSPYSAPPTVQAPYLPFQLIAPHQLPASVDWSTFMPSMDVSSPGLSYDVYASTTTNGPFRQGRSGEDWLFNAPLGSLAGPVDTDPFTALAHLARMPATTMLDPGSVALLSSPMHDYLIASFMARRREYGLQVDEERLLTSFALPPDHSAAVHPALRNAVYLLSCRALNSQTPALAQYEPSFVDKVRQGIADALEAAHRGDNTHLFTGVILASTLLARYLLIMGRIREAYHQIASVVRFAVSCGLHQLSSYNLGPHSPSSRAPPLLPPPTDYMALGERIHAFWAIFSLDRTIVAVAGLPSAFGDDGSDYVDACEKITTQWPRPLQDYRSPDLLAQSGPAGSLADYFAGGSPRGSPNSRPVNLSICTLAMWALEIHHRAHDALRRTGQAGSGTSTRLPLLSRSVLRFLREAPGVESFDDDSGRTGCNPTLVLAYSLIFAAQIKLVLAQHGRTAYVSANADEAIAAAAQLVGMLGRARNVAGLDPMVGICGVFTLGFLKRVGYGAHSDELIEQLERSAAQLRKTHVMLGDVQLELKDLP